MFYKRIVYVWICFLLTIVIGTISVSILVDPINIWGTPIINGFNNYKVKQRVFLEIAKPYEYARVKPDVVYIGSSRVYVGIPPVHHGIKDEKVFNMGQSSLSLPDMQEYLRFMYKIHKPQIVYIGLDVFQFGKENFSTPRESFSVARLNATVGKLSRWGSALQDGISAIRYIPETVSSSWIHKEQPALFVRGWDVAKGTYGGVFPKEYYYNLSRNCVKVYSDFEYEPEALACLQQIVEEAEHADVKVQCFFSPESIDAYAIGNLLQQREQRKKIKLAVANICPVYDFDFPNLYTENRSLYYDAMHYRQELGNFILDTMFSGRESALCYKLEGASVEQKLVAEDVAYSVWAKDNQDYLAQLTQLIAMNKEIPEGTLQQYLGF